VFVGASRDPHEILMERIPLASRVWGLSSENLNLGDLS
jgi:hypothetical protein